FLAGGRGQRPAAREHDPRVRRGTGPGRAACGGPAYRGVHARDRPRCSRAAAAGSVRLTRPPAVTTAEFSEPFQRFTSLLAAAEAVERALLPEPTAFALATVSADGRPSARMLLLKGVDSRGFVFYTNYEGRKGRELGERPVAAMCFHWQPLEVQVRVEGSVSRVSEAESDAYFATRPRERQLGAWASVQSSELVEPADFRRRLEEFESRFAGADVPRPPHWGGFRLAPARIEFWRNRANRWHDRELYERDGAGWQVSL